MSSSKPSIIGNKFLDEDDITQECKDLISTLPKEQDYWIVGSYLYQYQGFWHNSRQLQGVLTCQKHFQAHDNDIILVTCPKSGTTWLKALAFSLLNRKKYPDTQNNHPLLTTNSHDLVPFLELRLYIEKDSIPNLDSLPCPRLFSTHIPYVSMPKSVIDSNCKIVYLCRDPKDTFVSMWYFAKKLRAKNNGTNSLEECYEKFCKGISPYGPFWEHILGFWKLSLEMPNKVMFLRFEDMKSNPDLVLKELAEFIGCPFSKEELAKGMVDDILKLCSFDNLSNLEVNKNGKLSSGTENKVFFRCGEIGDWKNHLTGEMIEELNNITEKKLGKHGLRF